MSVRRVLPAYASVVLAVLAAIISVGPPSPLKADASRISAPPSGCPRVSPALDIRADHKENRSPAVAFNPIHGEWLVVWHTEQDASTWDIWAARLNADGEVIQAFNAITSPGVQRWGPVVAFSPAQDQYLVVYTRDTSPTNRGVYATRVNWNGGWVSAEIPLGVVPKNQYYPAVTYNDEDDEYLVVYTIASAGGGEEIDALRVRASDGQIMSWEEVQPGTDGKRTMADVAYNRQRNEYLIAYGFVGSAPPHPPQIRGKVAAASLAGLGSAPEMELCCDPNAGPQQWGASVAAGPDEYLVTFQSGLISASLYGRRIAHTGEPLGPNTGFPLTELRLNSLLGADVASAGDDYLATWDAPPASGPGDEDVYGCQVKAGQDRAAGDDFGIEDGVSRQTYPRLACTHQGNCLVVYEDNSPDGTSYRIRGRFVTPCPRVFLPFVPRLH